ncbi:MAG: hypothetical protein H6625_12430 [Bdellovibrionaceae bacterium]|nr:hypothetical protein [Pseudobdellovibrionaceae bacterium]
MESKSRGAERAFLIEQVFDSWEEYQAYYEEACKVWSAVAKQDTIFVSS